MIVERHAHIKENEIVPADVTNGSLEVEDCFETGGKSDIGVDSCHYPKKIIG